MRRFPHMPKEPMSPPSPTDPIALKDRYASSLNDILNTSQLVAKQIEILDAKQTNWNKLKRKVEGDTKHAAKKIKLDVGGKIFCIGKSHLLSVEGSYFHAMLSSGRWIPDSDGAYFVDRSRKQFGRIMDYLRTGKLSFEGLRPNQIKTLKKTLEYLQMSLPTSVQSRVTWDPQMCGSGLVLSQGNRVVANSGAYSRSVRSLEPCNRYSVRLDDHKKCLDSDVMIDFAPLEGFKPNSHVLYKSCGWYLYGLNGMLYSQNSYGAKSYIEGGIALGSVVTCTLDRERDCISFEINGRQCGVAFVNIPQVEVYAALYFAGSFNVQLSLKD